MKLKPFYTLRELAEIGGISKKRMQLMLKQAGISLETNGTKRVVYVSRMKEHLPQLWDSLVACMEVRGLAD